MSRMKSGGGRKKRFELKAFRCLESGESRVRNADLIMSLCIKYGRTNGYGAKRRRRKQKSSISDDGGER